MRVWDDVWSITTEWRVSELENGEENMVNGALGRGTEYTEWIMGTEREEQRTEEHGMWKIKYTENRMACENRGWSEEDAEW